MPRPRLPHFVIVKSPGLLPMYFKVSKLTESLCVPNRTLRDWLVTSMPHFRDQRNNLWCPPRATENRRETWLPGIMKKVIHHWAPSSYASLFRTPSGPPRMKRKNRAKHSAFLFFYPNFLHNKRPLTSYASRSPWLPMFYRTRDSAHRS